MSSRHSSLKVFSANLANSPAPPPSPTIPTLLELQLCLLLCLLLGSCHLKSWAPSGAGSVILDGCCVRAETAGQLNGLRKHARRHRLTAQATGADARKHRTVFSHWNFLGLVRQSCVRCERFQVELLQTTNREETICSAITQSCQWRITQSLLSITLFQQATLITFFEVRCSHWNE